MKSLSYIVNAVDGFSYKKLFGCFGMNKILRQATKDNSRPANDSICIGVNFKFKAGVYLKNEKSKLEKKLENWPCKLFYLILMANLWYKKVLVFTYDKIN